MICHHIAFLVKCRFCYKVAPSSEEKQRINWRRKKNKTGKCFFTEKIKAILGILIEKLFKPVIHRSNLHPFKWLMNFIKHTQTHMHTQMDIYTYIHIISVYILYLHVYYVSMYSIYVSRDLYI